MAIVVMTDRERTPRCVRVTKMELHVRPIPNGKGVKEYVMFGGISYYQ